MLLSFVIFSPIISMGMGFACGIIWSMIFSGISTHQE